MVRTCLVLTILCVMSQAKAETGAVQQRADLQVGGPLRMVKGGNSDSPGSTDGVVYADILIEPAYGVSSSLSQSGNADGQVMTNLKLGENGEPGMTYSLTRSLSLGVGYHFVEAEDLVGDRAFAGTIDADHQSHHVLFRAKWRFQ